MASPTTVQFQTLASSTVRSGPC